MRLNGCHNRKAFLPAMVVQDGWTWADTLEGGSTRVPVMVRIPFRNRPDCVYSTSDLGRADAGCSGCRWRQG